MEVSLAIPLAIVAVFALIAAIVDVCKFRVPNNLTMPVLLLGLGYHALVGGFAGLGFSLLGVLAGFGVLFVPYLIGATGAGDVKLMAAVGAWLGLPATIYVFAVAAIAGVCYSLVVFARYGGLGNALALIQASMMQLSAMGKHLGAEERVETVVRRGDRKRLIPFAAMIALGIVIVFCVYYFRGPMGPLFGG